MRLNGDLSIQVLDGFRLVFTAEGNGRVGALFQGAAKNNYSFTMVGPDGVCIGGDHGRLLKMMSAMVKWCGDSLTVTASQAARPLELRMLKLLRIETQ